MAYGVSIFNAGNSHQHCRPTTFWTIKKDSENITYCLWLPEGAWVVFSRPDVTINIFFNIHLETKRSLDSLEHNSRFKIKLKSIKKIHRTLDFGGLHWNNHLKSRSFCWWRFICKTRANEDIESVWYSKSRPTHSHTYTTSKPALTECYYWFPVSQHHPTALYSHVT